MRRKPKHHAFRDTILTLPPNLGWDIRELLPDTRFRSLKAFLLHALRQEFNRQVEFRILVQDIKKATDQVDGVEKTNTFEAAFAKFRNTRMEQAGEEAFVAQETAQKERWERRKRDQEIAMRESI